MGVASYFLAEKNVRLYDREFYEYLKGRARPDSPAKVKQGYTERSR